LKIAVFNRIFSKKAGGAERYSVALVEELAAKHEIHVFAQDISHSWPGVTYHRISAPLRRFRWLNQLWYATATWWATRSGFDIVHSHENTWHGNVQTVHVLPIKHNLLSSRAGWAKVRVWLKVITSPRLLAYLALERGRFAKQAHRHIIVTSPSLRHIFNTAYPNNSNALSVITPGVAKADLAVDIGASKRSVKRLLGVPEDGFTIAFVGNRYDIKGLPTLLLALQAMTEQVNLLVAGNAEQVTIYQAQADKLGIGQRVRFLGAVNGVEQVYLAADCLAHPTLEDTFAMVVLEAMSYGLPVVVSREKFCGIAGLLTNGLNALILDEPKNEIALSQLLQSIVDNAELRARLSDQALKFADGFAWAQIAQEQEQIYAKITS
jgi:glycosyltransferase involved in cell wall biosynthesis